MMFVPPCFYVLVSQQIHNLTWLSLTEDVVFQCSHKSINVPPSCLLDFRMFRVQAHLWNVAARSSFKTFLRTVTHGSQRSYINMIRDSVLSRHMEINQENISSENALNVVFFSNKHNSMSQRLCLELEKRNHNVKVQ
jgi:hypothetical protein